MELWIIESIEDFLQDSQYNGFVVLKDLQANDMEHISKIAFDCGKAVLLVPSKVGV